MGAINQFMPVFVVPKEEPEDESFQHPEDAVRDSFDSIEDFDEYLEKHFFSTFAGEEVRRFGRSAGNDLHLIPGVTELSKKELIENLSGGELTWEEVIEYGDAVTLLINDVESGDGAYLGFDEDGGYFVLYSNIPKGEYIDEPLLQRLKKVPATSRMHVSSEKLESLAEEVAIDSNELANSRGSTQTVEEQLQSIPHSDEIIFKRKRGSDIRSPIGEKVKRTMNYYGNDAASVVPQVTREFGMQISSIRLVYPDNASFKINRDGVLKLIKGSLSYMLEKVDSIITETLNVKRAYDNTETSAYSLDNQTISKSTPATISFEDQAVTTTTIEKLFNTLAEANLVPIDRYIESDELYYSSSVYYVNDRSYFDIRGDEDSLRLFPRDKEKDLKTFFQVFDVIQAVISNEASVTLDTNRSDNGGEGS